MKEWIYNHSPVAVQNLMTTLYGRQLHRQRYGATSARYVKELEQTEYGSAEEIAAFQQRSLAALLRHACETTDYYRDLFREHGIGKDDLDSPHILATIPVLTKDLLRSRLEAFVSGEFKKRDLFRLYTSGTTGSPLTVYCDVESRRRNYAFFSRVRQWRGVRLGDRRATFYGRIVVPPRQKGPPFWRYDATENNLLFSSYHISEENFPAYYEKLSSFAPREIRGYPSSLYNLSRLIREKGRPPLAPQAVFTTAETLLDPARETIEEGLGCSVTDTFGCTEMAFYITQCEKGTYHVHPEYGIVETLDADGRPVWDAPGESVCTSFVNRAMPLIRYRVGDTLVLSRDGCLCGRHFPVVKSIIGRTDDVIRTPEGTLVGRLDPIFKGGLGIREAQIVQTSLEEVVLKVVKGNGFAEGDITFLENELRKRIGPSMVIRVEYTDRIPRDASGKFRSVISRVHPQA